MRNNASSPTNKHHIYFYDKKWKAYKSYFAALELCPDWRVAHSLQHNLELSQLRYGFNALAFSLYWPHLTLIHILFACGSQSCRKINERMKARSYCKNVVTIQMTVYVSCQFACWYIAESLSSAVAWLIKSECMLRKMWIT